jgi:hypothetical protein
MTNIHLKWYCRIVNVMYTVSEKDCTLFFIFFFEGPGIELP